MNNYKKRSLPGCNFYTKFGALVPVVKRWLVCGKLIVSVFSNNPIQYGVINLPMKIKKTLQEHRKSLQILNAET